MESASDVAHKEDQRRSRMVLLEGSDVGVTQPVRGDPLAVAIGRRVVM